MDSLHTCPTYSEDASELSTHNMKGGLPLRKRKLMGKNSQIPKRNLAEKACKQYETIKDNAI